MAAGPTMGLRVKHKKPFKFVYLVPMRLVTRCYSLVRANKKVAAEPPMGLYSLGLAYTQNVQNPLEMCIFGAMGPVTRRLPLLNLSLAVAAAAGGLANHGPRGGDSY